MRKLLTLMFTVMGFAAFCPNPASALVFSAPKPKFSYTDASGKKQSVEVVDKYYPKKIVKPFAKVDSQIDPKLRGPLPLPRNAPTRTRFPSAGVLLKKRSLLRA